jgi:receptor protein-tyrosine kinase
MLGSDSFEADQYRVLCHFVEQARVDRKQSVLAVTSAAVGDGKTTTAINLAAMLAQSPGLRVLLVDTDLRRPLVAANLGLEDPGPGLVGALLDRRQDLASVVRTTPCRLDVLPAGQAPGNPYHVLDSPAVGQLLEVARARYDCVILDTPPLLVVPDCRLMSQWVDGFLVVVAAHRTPQRLLAETLSALDPDKTIGIVFNRDDRLLTGSYKRYYAAYRRGRSTRAVGAGFWSRLWRGPQRRSPGGWQ